MVDQEKFKNQIKQDQVKNKIDQAIRNLNKNRTQLENLLLRISIQENPNAVSINGILENLKILNDAMKYLFTLKEADNLEAFTITLSKLIDEEKEA